MTIVRDLCVVAASVALLSGVAHAQGSEAQGPTGDPASEPVTLDLDAELQRGTVSLSLERAVQLALGSAPRIEESEAAKRQALQQKARAAIGFYPHATLTARYTRLLNVQGGRFTAHKGAVPKNYFTQLANQPDNAPASAFDQAAAGTLDGIVRDGIVVPVYANRYSLRTELNYPISDLLLTVLPNYRAAESALRAESLKGARARQLVVAETHEAYFDYVRARAEFVVAEFTLRQSESQTQDIEAKVEAGSLPEVELLRAKTQLATALASVERARARMASAHASLSQLLHQDLPQTIGIEESLYAAAPELSEDVASLVAEGRRKRADLAAASKSMSSQRATARARRGAGWPRVSVIAGMDAARPKPWVVPQVNRFGVTGDISILVGWSPDQYVDAQRQGDQVQAEEARARANLRAVEDELTLEITQALEDYGAALRVLRALAAGVSSAEENYRIRREQLRAGAAVPREIIDAQADLQRARLDVLHAALDVKLSRNRLNYAVGRD